jgi:hypothetical protein
MIYVSIYLSFVRFIRRYIHEHENDRNVCVCFIRDVVPVVLPTYRPWMSLVRDISMHFEARRHVLGGKKGDGHTFGFQFDRSPPMDL